MKKLSVLILDDHPVFRNGVLKLLNEIPSIGLVYETGNSHEAFDLIRNEKVDVLLLDLSMPDLSGFDFLDALNDMDIPKNPKRIILTMLEDLGTMVACYRKGIHGYIPKSTERNEVFKLFERLSEDETYFSKKVSNFLFSQAMSKFGGNDPEIFPTLTDSEIKVIILNCFQMTISEMSDILFLSPGTLRTHRHNAYKKSNTRNMVGLGFFALEKGYVTKNDLKSGDYKKALERRFPKFLKPL